MNKKIISILLLSITLFLLCSCEYLEYNDTSANESFSKINSICELATLKCYYHNIVRFEESSSDTIAQILGNIGYKKMWIEYSGIVNLGIKVGKVTIEQPDKNNVVKVTIPKAEILSVDFDVNSLSDPLTETGFLTSITASDQTKALGEAQKDMEKKAKQDETLLLQAQNRAKNLIEEYIKNAGMALGKTYTVQWVDK